jgi:alpha-tubulin suppressor-like RCC1 family protein/predicted RNA-binding Zn-ribbon protein involved in translation (DUF1610 family)
MITYSCTQCGASITVEDDAHIGKCPACGALFVLPNQFAQRQNFYRLAGDARRANNFGLALTYYSRILKVDATDPEAHWGYLLSKYGVEVSQDAATLNQIFFHRIEHSSFLADPSYEKMITYCPTEARYYYEEMSRRIEARHSRMLEVSRQTKEFDIYIDCVERPGTADYIIANQLGKALDDVGYRVFLPATMLGDLSPEERNIHEMAVAEKAAAMMVVVTPATKLDNREFSSVWKRFLAFRKQDAGRKLLSVYRDIQPEALPLELQPFQSMECGGSDFQTKAIREVNRMFGRQDRAAELNRNILEGLRRGKELLGERRFSEAKKEFLKVRELDAREAEAHWGLVLAETENLEKPVLRDELDTNYKQAVDCAEADQKVRYERAMSALMTEPSWQELCRVTENFDRTAEASSPGVIKAKERFKLYTPRGDARLAQIDEYEKRAEADLEALALLESYDHRDSAVESLFTEQAKAENNVADISLTKSIFLDEYPLVSSMICIALVLLTAAELLLIYHFEASSGNEGFAYIVASWLFRIGTLLALVWACHMSPLIDHESEVHPVAILICLVVDYIIFRLAESRPCQFYFGMFAVSMAGLLIQSLMAVAPAHTIKRETEQYNSARTRLMAVDGQIAENFQEHIRQIYTQSGVTQRMTFEYTPAHSKNFRDKGPEEKAKNPFSYLIKSAAICAVVLAAATFVSNMIYTSGWSKIESIAPSYYHVAALKENGTVVANGLNNYGQCNTNGWEKITQVVTGNNFTAGLKEDGTVLVAGGSEDVFDVVSEWTDIVFLSASGHHLVGLKSNGKVVAAGSNDNGECDVGIFSDVAIIRAITNSSGSFTVILTNSGKLDITASENSSDIKSWMNSNTGDADGAYRFTKLYGDCAQFVATTEDGWCDWFGSNEYSQLDDVCDWDGREIADIWAGDSVVGLKNDGSVLYSGSNKTMENQTSKWNDIVAISGSVDYVLGLKSDGTVVASGDDSSNQLEVDTWKNVEKLYTGYRTSYGVKKNGSVTAAGYGYGGVAYVSAKSPIGVLKFWMSAFDW